MPKVWSEEELPPEWNISVKKGDVKECSNYRGISILNTAYKILSIILCERLKPYLSSIIGPYQYGFRPGKSTVDQMFTLRQILEKTREFNIDTHHLFIDFKQAYDSIRRNKFLTAVYALGIPAKLVDMCSLTLADTKSLVKVDGQHRYHR